VAFPHQIIQSLTQQMAVRIGIHISNGIVYAKSIEKMRRVHTFAFPFAAGFSHSDQMSL
jgi:hypothetical protein